MELNTVLELVKAGFTKDEIMQMAQSTTAVPNPEPVQIATSIPEQKAEPVQEPVAEPVAVAPPAPQPVQQEAQPSMADIMQSIARLTSAVQANAIAQSVIPQGLQNQPSAEDMLAEIIRPTFKKGTSPAKSNRIEIKTQKPKEEKPKAAAVQKTNDLAGQMSLFDL